MLPNTQIIVITILQIITQLFALAEISQVQNNNISVEPTIRHLTSNIFLTLNIKTLASKRINQYYLVHNYLVLLNSAEHRNLGKIVKLTRVDKEKINNETRLFITLLDEIIEEDIKPEVKTETDEEHVVKEISLFLDEIEQKHNLKNAKLDINACIIERLNKDYETYEYDASKETGYLESLGSHHDDNEFWEPSRRRIFKGSRTNIKDFPFMASILVFNQFQCAGSIIKDDLIISASSCLQLAWNNRFFRENPAFLSVRVGSTFSNGGGEIIRVLEVNFHPQYDPKNLRNNLCLLRLTRKLNFKKKKKVKKIQIDRQPSALAMNTDDITIVGWGAKTPSNILTNPIMSYGVLDVCDYKKCQKIYSRMYVTRKNFCAGYKPRGGACNRDVGGPGIVNGVLMGVVTFGSPVCGARGSPTVFTKLGYYADWIGAIMKAEVPYVRKRPKTARPRSWHNYTLPTVKQSEFRIAPVLDKQTKTTYHLHTAKYTPPIERTEIDPNEEFTFEIQIAKILKDNHLFDEFIKTIFNSREFGEYKELLKDSDEEFREIDIKTATTESNLIYSTLKVAERTLMGEVDPEPQSELDISNQRVDFSPHTTAIQQFSRTKSKKEIPKPVTKKKKFTPTSAIPSQNSLPNNKPDFEAIIPPLLKELKPVIKKNIMKQQIEQNLVNFIDNKSLKKILKKSSQDEDLDDDAILDLLKQGKNNGQLEDMDDSFLTLLSSEDEIEALSANLNNDSYQTEEGIDIDISPFVDNAEYIQI